MTWEEFHQYDESFDDERSEVRCDRCRERHLHWGGHPGAWRLFNDDGALHICPGATAAAEEFPIE